MVLSSRFLTVTFTLFAVIDIIGSIPVLVGLREKMGNIHAHRQRLYQVFS